MKTFEEYLDKMGYSWNDFDCTSEMEGLIEQYANEKISQTLRIHDVGGSLRYSEREIDFAYLAGVFNVSGIDGLQKEIERLKGLGKNPHDIIIAAREQ